MSNGRKAATLIGLVSAGCATTPAQPTPLLCPASLTLADIRSRELEGGYASHELSRWFEAAKPQGVVLAFHGLNNTPTMMDALASHLQNEGFSVLRGGLAGHGQGDEAFRTVTRVQWLDDVRLHYCTAKTEADRLGVPLHFLGFSLGALMEMDFLTSHAQVSVSRAALFAPALTPRWYSALLRGSRWIPRVMLPGYTPRDYRAHSGTTGAAYHALFQAADALETADAAPLRIPVLAFIDPDDMTVSYRGLQTFVRSRSLTSWRIETTTTEGGSVSGSKHHLIIDPASLGETEWKRVSNELVRFLKDAPR